MPELKKVQDMCTESSKKTAPVVAMYDDFRENERYGVEWDSASSMTAYGASFAAMVYALVI